MVLKQSPTQACTCKTVMRFPEGQVKAKCPCGAVWELGFEGYWFIANQITSNLASSQDNIASPQNKLPTRRQDRYKNYPKQRRRKGR